jgi:ferredoxin
LTTYGHGSRTPAAHGAAAQRPMAQRPTAQRPVAEPVERLRVNPIACVARGICAELLPEVVQLDEWGYPILGDGGIPESLLDLARQAVSDCPTLALRLERVTK